MKLIGNMMMKTQSRKAKGRRLQQKFMQLLIEKLDIDPEDIDWTKLQEYEEKDMTHGSQELACSAEGGCEIVALVAVCHGRY